MFSMTDFVRYIARHLVDNPDKVFVQRVGGNTMSIVELHVAKMDVGQVIGKNGRTAEAIRTIIRAISTKEKKLQFLKPLNRSFS
jgi:predicted RNA-binding protein YlqC (UPF0109 family)